MTKRLYRSIVGRLLDTLDKDLSGVSGPQHFTRSYCRPFFVTTECLSAAFAPASAAKWAWTPPPSAYCRRSGNAARSETDHLRAMSAIKQNFAQKSHARQTVRQNESMFSADAVDLPG
jgi:hypothetical protein